jgi:hypothetical protein
MKEPFDLKERLERFRRLKESSSYVRPSYAKRTFSIEEDILKRFLQIIVERNYKVQDCISEAIALWLDKYDKSS